MGKVIEALVAILVPFTLLFTLVFFVCGGKIKRSSRLNTKHWTVEEFVGHTKYRECYRVSNNIECLSSLYHIAPRTAKHYIGAPYPVSNSTLYGVERFDDYYYIVLNIDEYGRVFGRIAIKEEIK